MTTAILPAPNDLDQPTHQRIVKRFTTRQARAAMLGVELIDVGCDGGASTYFLRQGATHVPLASLAEVDAALSAMAVKPPRGASANDKLFAPTARIALLMQRLARHDVMLVHEPYGPPYFRLFRAGNDIGLLRNLEHGEAIADRLDLEAK
ncbi:hypothetical protein GCM10023165_42780 [Variovorax defluvii]|uniref:SAM-dependent methyltransferase n=1 Tax=Variovorax defluvii TaxID=913761 RepID=A0ABP8I7U9_9BURK